MSGFKWDDHPIVDKNSQQTPSGFSWDDHPVVNQKAPEYDYSNVVQAAKDLTKAATIDGLPVYGQVIGSTLGVIGGPQGMAFGGGLGQAAGESLRKGLYGVGELISGERSLSDELRLPTKEEVAQVVNDTGKEFILGSTVEAGGQIAGKAIQAVPKIVSGAGNYLKNSAEKLAENATGATRVQAEKFADGAGRELLDRGIVKFGDSAEQIAARSAKEIKAAEQGIDSSLKALDDAGAKVDVNTVVSNLESKIAQLKKDPSQADIVKKLEGIVLDITGTGESSITLNAAEKTKRGFNKMAKNWMNPEQGEAGKAAYLAYRDAVEESAKAADPAIAKTFTNSKKTFGLMAPIEEAASKRAAQLNQSPIGGFLDVTSGLVGGGVAGIPGAVAAATGRRFVAPRISSSMAVAADNLSKPLMNSSKAVARATPAAEQVATNVLRAAESTKSAPPKGVDLWVAKGQQRVAETDPSLDADFLDQVKSNKKFKDQLIRAGELSPGSGRMKEVIESIKSSPEYKQFLKEKEKQAQGKEPDQAMVKPAIKFPLVVQKDGYTAVVRNADELSEAKSEGWA